MTNEFGIEYIAVGERKNMVAEYAAFDPTLMGLPHKSCRYLVKAVGKHDYDTDWFPTLKEAVAEAKMLAAQLGVNTASV